MSSSNIYQSITLGDGDIRLVTLLPGRRCDPIVCELERKFLPPLADSNTPPSQSHGPEYTALSYTWGDCHNQREIQCNGYPFSVGSNLHSALLHLRDEQSPRVFWIDAICIDQKSIDERNLQVPRMRDIYSRSAQTVIWLGNGGFFSRQGMKAAAYLAQRARGREDSLRTATSRFWWIGEVVYAIILIVYLTSFLLLLRRPYFSRIWVIQEVALSRSPVVVCGNDTALFGGFASAAGKIRHDMFGDNHAWNLSNILIMRSFTRAPLNTGSDPPWLPPEAILGRTTIDRDLLFLLSLFRGSHATDPKDKVFGLLGLCEEIEGVDTYGIKPAYGLTVEQVYIHVAIAILRQQRNLNLFNAVRYVPLRMNQGTPDLPSWVPDWSDTATIAAPLSTRRNNDNSATGNTSHIFMPVKEILESFPQTLPGLESFPRTLYLSGHLIDEIVELGPECNTERARRSAWFYVMFIITIPDSHRLRTLLKWERQFHQEDPSFMRMFITTVTTDHDSNFSPDYVTNLFTRFRKRLVRDVPFFARIVQAFLVYLIVRSFSLILSHRYGAFQGVVVNGILAISAMSLLTCVMLLIDPHIGWSDNLLDRCVKIELRRMARTRTGRLALVPAASCLGDTVALCKGGSVPLVLRRHAEGFQLMGESYVHGVMNGEGFIEEQCQVLCID